VPSSTLFYAQAWALTHMLLLAPRYADGFPDLTAKLLAGTPGPAALSAVYRKPIETIARDARAWSDRHSFDPVRLPVVSGAAHAAVVEQLSSVESRLILADLLALSGALDRAGALYRDLEREAPDSAAVAAGRGAIALRLSRAQEATRYFQRAVELGIADAAVCYQFALLADSAGLSQTVIRSALQRALDLDPAFDDAHYRLALLDANAERHESAVAHLKAMKIVRRDRAHAYWTTMADALIGLDRRDEAIEASRYAASHATTEDERSHAKQLAYVAQTDLAVRFTRDASGKLQLSTTRVPHDSVDRNPFVEAADQIRKVQARLVNVECGAGILTVSVETSEGQLRLAIPDPSHVQLRNGPSEFTCGPQPANPISVVYAVSRQSESNIDGVVRGIDF
jgi:tetratricopeptide (TPR) repeat protein